MEDSRVDDLLDSLQTLFNEQPETIETGLDVDSAELLQLRKACRLLEAADHLVRENGYYTVVIEASFAAIERTLQFYLLEHGFIQPDEYINHQDVYEQSCDAGLYSEAFKEDLITLWRENRSWSYYREGVGSAERAEHMSALANAIHSYVLQLAGKRHECICQ